jgi:hypothetical protein
MSKKEVWQSVSWTFKMLLTAVLGLLWLLAPSIVVFNVGMLLGPTIGWTSEMVRLASTNAFIVWTSVQIAFIAFDRYVHTKIRTGIEEYHEEFIILKRHWISSVGAPVDLETLKSLKHKLAIK